MLYRTLEKNKFKEIEVRELFFNECDLVIPETGHL